MVAEFNTEQYIQIFTIPNYRLASNNPIYVITLLNNTHCSDGDGFDNASTSLKAINCDLHPTIFLRLLLAVLPT